MIEPLDQGTQKRLVKMEHDLLAANDQHAREVRELMAAKKVLCLNLVSSPGAGKTTLLVETIKALGDRFPLAVIEGDQQTARDADRIRETGAHAIQINTGKGCHLEAWTIRRALEQLTLQEGSVLFVENVGNLVCPAEFDLGEAHKVAILSTAEGDDKPIKYPHMFAASDLMIVNKSDLLPYVDFDVERCIEFARRVNPHIEVITLSAKTGEGLDTWLEWVDSRRV